jgi:uncharacterized protein
MADILSPATETNLNQQISQLEAKNGSEIAVVTVPDTAPSASPKEFATTLFNHWGIGKKGKDNGVLLLISQGDRRVEIETGYGVEGILPDAKVGNIIQKDITPKFKKSDFNGGTLAGTKALIVSLSGNASPIRSSADQLSSSTPNVSSTPDSSNLAAEDKAGIGEFGWIYGLVGGIGAWAGIAYFRSRRPIILEPEGRSRTKKQDLRRPGHCASCQQPMKRLDYSSIQSHLSRPEQVAHQIGSVNFVGWQCPSCHSHLAKPGIHIRAYASASTDFSNCPTCHELTVRRSSRVLQSPTQYSEGRRLITYTCQCCHYHKEIDETIPRLPPPPPPSSSSGSWNSSSGSSGGFSGGGSSGGGFGGGSSGGGGAGGSW